jgi:ERCC4-related helicase
MTGQVSLALSLSSHETLDLLHAACLRNGVGHPVTEIVSSLCDTITETDNDKRASAFAEIEHMAAKLGRAAQRTACDATPPPVDLRRYL